MLLLRLLVENVELVKVGYLNLWCHMMKHKRRLGCLQPFLLLINVDDGIHSCFIAFHLALCWLCSFFGHYYRFVCVYSYGSFAGQILHLCPGVRCFHAISSAWVSCATHATEAAGWD